MFRRFAVIAWFPNGIPVVISPMLGVSLVMVFVGAAACAIPALRVLKVHPKEALRGAVGARSGDTIAWARITRRGQGASTWARRKAKRSRRRYARVLRLPVDFKHYFIE